MTERSRIFTVEKCIELGRCIHCEMDPIKQGHAADCDRHQHQPRQR